MLYKLDDKLPGCRLSQEEWEELREMTIPYEGHLKEMDLAPVKQRFSEIRKRRKRRNMLAVRNLSCACAWDGPVPGVLPLLL